MGHRWSVYQGAPSSRVSGHFLRATSLHPSLLVPNLRALPALSTLPVTLRDRTDDVTLQSFLVNWTSVVTLVDARTIEGISRAITHHKHLERLDIIPIPIDDVALTHIAMSPKLKKSTLVLHPDKSKLHQVCIPSDTTPFRNVEHLFLEVWDLYVVTTLLRNQDQMFCSAATAADFPSTQYLHCLLRWHLPSAHIPFDQLVSSPIPPAELDEPAMGYHLMHDTSSPLASLCHLRELVVDLCCWFSIDDDDLLSLTRNWPLLQVLHLDCTQHVYGDVWRSAKYATFKGLLSLLECCPDLCDLCLPLDAREVPVNTGNIVCNPALARIRVPNSPIGESLYGGRDPRSTLPVCH